MDFMQISIDPRSLLEIARLLGFSVFLSEEMDIALHKITDMIVAKAQQETWAVFTAPTGELASTISANVKNPFEAEIVVDSPYGERREKGFSGMTAALGRTYTYDPAKPYLTPAFDQGNIESLVILETAINHVLERVVL